MSCFFVYPGGGGDLLGWLNSCPRKPFEVMCMVLHAHDEGDLPTEYLENVTDVSGLLNVCAARHTAMGKRITTLGREALVEGWYHLEDGKLTSNIDTRQNDHKKVVDLSDSTNPTIADNSDPRTGITMTMNGRSVMLDDIDSEFEQAGIELPSNRDRWDLEGYIIKEVVATPNKRPRCAKTQVAVNPNLGVIKSGLSAAILSRLEGNK